MRSMIFSAALVLSALVAMPAFAGDKGKASFPMPAAAFKAKVDARQAKARGHLEEHAKTLTADQAKELRAKFDAGVAAVNAEVTKATADGTVTKDEALAVHKVARENHMGGGHHGKHGGKKK